MRDIRELIPQQGEMVLLGRVLRHDSEETVCSVVPRASGLFGDGHSVPSWLCLEYMAQCVAVHGGLEDSDSEPEGGPPVGYLAGSRRLRWFCDGLPAGEELEVSARHVHGKEGLVVFDCALHDSKARCLAEGRIQAYVPRDREGTDS